MLCQWLRPLCTSERRLVWLSGQISPLVHSKLPWHKRARGPAQAHPFKGDAHPLTDFVATGQLRRLRARPGGERIMDRVQWPRLIASFGDLQCRANLPNLAIAGGKRSGPRASLLRGSQLGAYTRWVRRGTAHKADTAGELPYGPPRHSGGSIPIGNFDLSSRGAQP